MEGLLNNLLSPDKSSRETAEMQLEQLKCKNPFEFLQSLITTFTSTQEDNEKLLCCVILRQALPRSWSQLDSSSKSSIKSFLLNGFSCSSSWNTARNASYVISDLAIYIIQSETGEKWQNFLSFLLKSLKSRNLYQKFSGFLILSEIVPFFADTFSKLKDKLLKIFMKTIESSYFELRRATIQSFTIFISVINTSETLNYSEMLNPLLSSIQVLCLHSLEHGEACVKSLIELAETEPFYFKADLGTSFTFVEAVIGKVSAQNLKVNLLEFLMILIEKHVTVVFNKRQLLAGTCELIFNVLTQVGVDLHEGLETSMQKHVIGFIRKIIEIIGESVVDFYIKLAESVLYEQRNEEFYFAALMVLAETAQFVYNTEKLVNVVNAVHVFAVSEFCSLRWAACKIVKKLVKVEDKEFQTRLHLSVLPILFRGLSDPHQLVQRVALQACQHFLKVNEAEIAIKYSPDLLPLVLQCLATKLCSIPAIETVTIICLTSKEQISNFFPELFSHLTALIKDSTGEVRVQALECLLVLRKVLSRSEFLKIAPEYISIIQYLQEPQDRSLQTCCFKTLITLSKYLKSNFTVFLPFVMPHLLQSSSRMELNQLEDYLEVILSLIDATKGGFLQYMEKTSELILYLMKCELSDTSKVLVCHTASSLVDVIKESGNQDFFSILVIYARGFLNEIWKLCEQEAEVECLAEMLRSVSHIMAAPGYEFLTNEELKSMADVTWKIIKDKRNSSAKSEELQSAVGLIFQALFRGQGGSGIMEVVYVNVLGVFNASVSEEDLCFAIVILREIVNCVGSLLPYERIEEIAKVFVFYLSHSSHPIKKQCLYAFCSLSEQCPAGVFVKIAALVLGTLENCLNQLKDSKLLKDRKTKDVVLIAIGQIIKFKFACLNGVMIVPWWASFLPVTSHKQHAQEVHDFLADLVVNHIPVLVKNDKIVVTFIHIAFSDLCAQATLPKIKKIIEMYLEDSQMEYLYELLQSSQKYKVQKLLNYI